MTNEIENRFKEILNKIAEDNGFTIILMKEYGITLKKKLCGGHLWNPSYFIATVSEDTEEQIRDYIQSQKEK